MAPPSNGRGTREHVPVMLDEVLGVLKPRDGGVYVDGTFGAGGYSRAMLSAADCRVLALDRDPEAIRDGAVLEGAFAGRLKLIEGRFADMAMLVSEQDVDAVDGVVLDIGVSSMQLDAAARGFSIAHDGPLDMRMEMSGVTAADVVNKMPEERLRQVIAMLGEERRARAVARAVVKRRGERLFERTADLAEVVGSVVGKKPGDRVHPATRTFQALRIYINNELEQLVQALSAAEVLLREGGRLAVVTFHSLEDRIVKKFFAERCGRTARPSRHAPPAGEEPDQSFVDLTRGGLAPSPAEIAKNPRARSARLRAGQRTANAAFDFNPQLIGRNVPTLENSLC